MESIHSPIHHIIVSRLAAVWVGLSLLFGGIAYVLELDKINEFVVALAASESERFAQLGISLDAPAESEEARLLEKRARDFAAENFIAVRIYDRHDKRLTEVINPRHDAMRRMLAGHDGELPRDQQAHYERFTAGDTTLVHAVVPLRDGERRISGYFDGIFIVDPTTMKRLREDLIRALTVTMVAVLLTTIALYPVILSLNRKVLAFSREVVKGNLEMASVLGAAIAKRDSDTNAHNFRVTLYSIALGEAVGIGAVDMRALILGAFLHDVGKIGISDNILLKPARLDADEFSVMRTHVALGLEILEDAEWLQAALDVVGNHHEKFDGSGYPNGRKGEDIPLTARIFAIVDVFDALASERPYKQAMSCEEAIAIVRRDAGSHFDPRLVERFDRMACELHRRYSAAGEEALKAELREKGLQYFFAASQFTPA